jgi:hypothetical protein
MLAATGALSVLEAAPKIPEQRTPKRAGFDVDVPLGGSTQVQPGGAYPVSRGEFMSQLREAYIGCPWLSAPIDTVARTVTAGGLQIRPDDENEDAEAGQPTRPPDVQALQDLLDYCNPQMDIRQLLRGVVTDLQIYGDAFVEVVWLLGLPVALYLLDPATMTVLADEHGQVSGYLQALDRREVTFKPREVVHISMDSPYGSLYGVGVAQKALLPVKIWLYAAGVLKSTMARGNPPHLAIDWPLEVSISEVREWRAQYRTRNLGPDNIGNPVTTRGGANLTELQPGKLGDYLSIMDQTRDTILSEAGVPPAKVGVIEAGNLGGGTGPSQDKTFRVNTCGPVAELVLEKLNYALTRQAFGISGWSLILHDYDWRDDKVVEDIRDQRLRNGVWTLDDYLVDIGEPPVGKESGGEEHVIIDKSTIIRWADVVEASKAALTAKQAPAPAAGKPADDDEPDEPADDQPSKPGKPESPAESRFRRAITDRYHRLLHNRAA